MLLNIAITLCLLISATLSAELSLYEKDLVQTLIAAIKAPATALSLFDSCNPDETPESIISKKTESNVLFEHYPTLSKSLSYVSLGDFPTPITYCKNLSRECTSVDIFIKNDGLTGAIDSNGKRCFGGNKLRKLQYLLADACAHGHDTIITFGCAGSNHALQTAVCAQQLGLQCISILKPQPHSRIVRRNLLAHKAHNSVLYYTEDNSTREKMTLDLCLKHKRETGKLPYIIPTGGSIARGALGYVEAAFELKKQIDAGIMPTPDHIYVTLGSGGTAAGLLLGCKAAGVTTQLHFILDEPTDISTAYSHVQRLFSETNQLLHALDPAFPLYDANNTEVSNSSISGTRFIIENAYTGLAYGLFSAEGAAAIRTMRSYENIELDGVYTGKCFSGLLADLYNKKLRSSEKSNKNTTVLFWNTFCSEDLRPLIDTVDYHDLPLAFHKYFEEPVQPLDI